MHDTKSPSRHLNGEENKHLMSDLLPFSARDVDVARAFWPVAMQQPWLMQAVALGGQEGNLAAGL